MSLQKTSKHCWICGRRTKDWMERGGMYRCYQCKDKDR
jgi:hypothetical protein